MLKDGTISLGQVLQMLTQGQQIKIGGRCRVLSEEDLPKATPLMLVDGHQAIQHLVQAATLELLRFREGAIQRTTSETIYRSGVQTEIFRNAQGGTICVRRDGYVLEILGFLHGNQAFKIGLRDRRLDGNGEAGEQSLLNHYPVHHEQANGIRAGCLAAELSVHSAEPSAYLPEEDLRDFITDPDPFIYPWSKFDPGKFFPLWQQAFESGLAPWQPAAPIRGFAKHFVEQAERLLKKLGYHQAETVPAWFNAAKFFYHGNGYRFVQRIHRDNFEALETCLSELCARLSDSEEDCEHIAYGQEAWLVALQNVPPEFLCKERPYCEKYGRYYLDGYVWTNSPSSTDYCARLRKKLE